MRRCAAKLTKIAKGSKHALKLVPPRYGKTPYYSVEKRGFSGTYLDRSTKATDRPTAAKCLKLWKEEIEGTSLRAHLANLTFLDAAVNYMAATKQERFVQPIVEHFGHCPLSEITQQPIDELSIRLSARQLLQPAIGRSTRLYRLFSNTLVMEPS